MTNGRSCVTRRQWLRTIGFGTAAVAGHDRQSDFEADPETESEPLSQYPKVVTGVFNLRTDGEVIFLLVADSELSETEKDAVVDGLTVSSGRVERAPAVSLDFFEGFRVSEDAIPDQVSAAERSALRDDSDLFEELDDEINEASVVRGRIVDGADLPPSECRFCGLTTHFPRIGYAGPVPTVPGSDGSGLLNFTVQFHDGFIYQFPNAPYEAPDDEEPGAYKSGRYEIDDANVYNIAESETVMSFPDPGGADTVGVGDDDTIVPTIHHRAHPLFVSLRSLAFRRVPILNTIAFNYGAEDIFGASYVENVLTDTAQVTLSTYGTLAPTPPTTFTPESIALTVFFLGISVATPVIGGSVGTALLIGSTAYALNQAVEDLEDWGDTIDDAREEIISQRFNSLAIDDGCAPGNESPQCCQNAEGGDGPIDNACGGDLVGATVLSVSELTRFQAREAVPSIAGNSPERSEFVERVENYDSILREIDRQAQLFANQLEDGAAKSSAREYLQRLQTGHDDSLLGAERTILEKLRSEFERPAVSIDHPEDVFAGEEVSFSAVVPSDQIGTNTIRDYEWSFDPPQTAAAAITGKRVEIGFPEPGRYEVTLRVTDEADRTRTVTREFAVLEGDGFEDSGLDGYRGHIEFFDVANRAHSGDSGLVCKAKSNAETGRPIYNPGHRLRRGETVRWFGYPGMHQALTTKDLGHSYIALYFETDNYIWAGIDAYGVGLYQEPIRFKYHVEGQGIIGEDVDWFQIRKAGGQFDPEAWHRLEMTWTPRDNLLLECWDTDGNTFGAKRLKSAELSDRLSEFDDAAVGVVNATPLVRSWVDDIALAPGSIEETPSSPPDVTGDGARPTDPDGDGLYEDINGDGQVNVLDVATFLGHFGDTASDPAYFDFNDDGTVDILDVAALLRQT